MRLRLAPSFILRAAVLWLMLRAILLAAGRAMPPLFGERPTAAELLAHSPPVMLLAAGVTVVLVHVDVIAMHERAFQANLGYDRRSILTTAFLTALGLEVATAILAPVLLA
ncbi:MAG: hypothetical protein PVH00_00410 [Gemmatimonadota bacterium]|jgi:hypothetical protein